MFKKILKVLGIGAIIGGSINLVPMTYSESQAKTYTTDSYQTAYATNEGYKELLDADNTELMYYGAVLKYYLVNSVINGDADIAAIYADLDNYSPSTVDVFVQSLIASTINISLYGSSKKQEFFAESFIKWMLTPDAQKIRVENCWITFLLKFFQG
ncbi:hypothetical protein SCLARK_001097 [Spiroplasma clarkii]|uniref:hypothetical protein n=1 Tax=Spiroplasma clarkii TaxID=2139 RepID=UPI000B555393|nr:hypothetical protein [Spiroplasma clarkii]ARU91666.1 hypothetical protein SCLARK_001097 [Spiroplasma clarkii]